MGLMPWQKHLVNGIKLGELTVFAASRGTGKSRMTLDYMMSQSPNFKVLEKTHRVGWTMQYTVGCRLEVCQWIRNQDPFQWTELFDNTWHFSLNRFEISEKLYTLLILRWS